MQHSRGSSQDKKDEKHNMSILNNLAAFFNLMQGNSNSSNDNLENGRIKKASSDGHEEGGPKASVKVSQPQMAGSDG